VPLIRPMLIGLAVVQGRQERGSRNLSPAAQPAGSAINLWFSWVASSPDPSRPRMHFAGRNSRILRVTPTEPVRTLEGRQGARRRGRNRHL